MSDAVLIALIGMIQSWGNTIANGLAVTVPALGTALIAWMTWRNNQRSAARSEELKADLAAKATEIKTTVGAQITDHTATTSLYLKKGIERTQAEELLAIGEARGEARARGNTVPGDLK